MAEKFVESKLGASKVTLFEKPSCPYCVTAKEILKKYKFKDGHLEIVNINKEDFVESIQEYFRRKTGARTVPRVFIGEECIGGCSDLEPLHSSGELTTMLQKIGALQ
ncbi:glutaredoxin-1 [Discoglossus pictus]